VTEETQAQQPAPAGDNAPVQQPKFRQEIDLGDGSGVQVFEADSQDALIEKLVEAQKNATVKIKELNRKIKLGLRPGTRPQDAQTSQQNTFQPRQLSAEERFLLAQKFQNDPASALDEAFAAQFGMSAAQLFAEVNSTRQFRQQIEKSAREQSEAQAFIEAYPEYTPTPNNSDAMLRYLEAHNMPVSAENLALAYEDLSSSGLLETQAPATGEARIEQPRAKKASTGLSDRNQARVEVQDGLPDAESFRKLPAAERRAALYRLARMSGAGPAS